MDKDLTVSQLDRQNILNNDLAIAEIQNKRVFRAYTLKISCALRKVWLLHTLKWSLEQ